MSRSIRAVGLAIVIGTISFVSLGQGGAPAGDLVMAGTTSRRLPNGLKLILREQHGSPLTAVDLWIRAGSGAESEKEAGAAHFLEHMLFKGTTSRKKGEVDEAIENLGSFINAGSTRDGAHLYLTVSSKYLPQTLEILSDVVQNATLPEDEMELERRVILDELARDCNDWRKQAADAVRAALYPGSSYGRQILGSPEAIRAVSRAAALGFYRRLYRPNNATLVIVGDVTPDMAVSACERAFGGWRPGDPSTEAAAPADPPKPAKRLFEVSGATNLQVAAIGFPGPAGENERAVCTADIIASLLEDGTASRLAPALKGMAAPGEFGADFLTLKRPSSISLYAVASKAEPEKLIKAMEDAAARLSVGMLSQGELDYAKRKTLGTYLYNIETYSGQARELGMADLYGKHDFSMRYPALIKSITASEVQLFAKSYLDPANEVRIILKPEAAK